MKRDGSRRQSQDTLPGDKNARLAIWEHSDGSPFIDHTGPNALDFVHELFSSEHSDFVNEVQPYTNRNWLFYRNDAEDLTGEALQHKTQGFACTGVLALEEGSFDVGGEELNGKGTGRNQSTAWVRSVRGPQTLLARISLHRRDLWSLAWGQNLRLTGKSRWCLDGHVIDKYLASIVRIGVK
ncbi:hypothetical protein B0T21DRAFT_353676 [Apiosordaria backusii]|uniref:Uncharacterized protein n=1 Tax=Apiosordaria backusii TaxID=314023 RepID=A0AA40DFC9_9PEZI|nr:hypothetical protein B0T21DRAFT_353676 [Apiosordaria backusii]